MAIESQDRFSGDLDKLMRLKLVTKDNLIFNNRYEGTPTAGAVKIPVMNTEVPTVDYDRRNGAPLSYASSSFLTLPIDQERAVNELIDNYEASAVPHDVILNRLESASYSLAKDLDAFSINLLETANGAKVAKTANATTSAKAYEEVVKARTYLAETGVPDDGRWLIVSPEFYAKLMLCNVFIKEQDVSKELRDIGVIGMIAGFRVLESNMLAKKGGSINYTTEFIAGHPNWCHRVEEWQVKVAVKDLSGSEKLIGASAIKGRKVYGAMVSKGETLYHKRIEA